MANGGWYGTQEEWNRIEAPLELVDPELDQFARRYGLIITKNHKDWPERSIAWGGEIRCLLQIFLADETKLTWNLWLCASQDRSGKRYWKMEMPRREVPMAEIAKDISELLENGKRKLDEWSRQPETLELVTTLGR
jgi:hypothetical protein